MAKFNSTQTIKTTNKCGHAAYSMKDKKKLVTQVLTSFFNENKFYGDNSAEMQEVIESVVADQPEFIAKLAVFTRKEFNMRSVSHVLLSYLAHDPAGKPYTRMAVKAACLRGDDATEIMACYLNLFGKPIPNALKKGIADVMQGFDEYTLAKYKGNGKAVKMRDLLCLCRPTPKNEAQSDLWKRLLEDRLEIPYTWETELSANGNNAATWEKLIDSRKVGYMALLRNLRNILKANPSNIGKVLDTIQDPEAVKRSKQLPFRFLSAYKELEDIGGTRVFDALENAIEASIENMQTLPGKTVIAVDVSGSMGLPISAKSKVSCSEIAMLLGLMAHKICEDSIFYVFDDHIQKYALSKKYGILYTATKSPRGGATYMHLPFEKMISEHINADRIIILSDNQCNTPGCLRRKPVQTLADEYRKQTGNDIWVHAIDLQGYGTQQFYGKKTNIIAGWSEKVFDFIKLAEMGEGSLEETIENYAF
ncbi:MAG: TROVE domain-containing protein [Bacteroidaceae bacterium]|nr:TROVE domain-containing protein [Bacteroidaceae bacterium]